MQALERRAASRSVADGPADAVLVGFTRDFDYDALTPRRRRRSVGGARLIGTNDDATYPTPDGPIPGGGALLAAVATASGPRPVVAGKPYAADGRPRAGRGRPAAGEGAVMVGDRLETDGDFAAPLGVDVRRWCARA